MSDIEVGDRVKVTFETTVTDRTDGCLCTWVNGGAPEIQPGYLRHEGVTVEKIEPPVEIFGPGDLLRHKYMNSYWYLAENGYVRLAAGRFANVVGFNPYEDASFTSEDYERVSLD